MFMPLLTSFLLFIFILHRAIHRADDRTRAENAAFFKKEHDANFVRKKSLDDLDYIHIPVDRLPFGALPDNAAVRDAEAEVRRLSEVHIVNFTGISNTDLKLKYGTANITPLSEYDQNYMSLARVLQKWGRELYASGLYEEAASVLLFAIDTRTDVSQTWHLAIECLRYHMGLSDEESKARLRGLLPIAESLDALSRDHIVHELQDALNA